MKERQQSTSTYAIGFLLVSSTDHVTPVTGLGGSVTVTISKSYGAFASPSATIGEVGNGWYSLSGSGLATDLGTLGDIVIHAFGTGSDPTDVTYTVVAYNPFDPVRLGLTALPNAAAAASGGLHVNGANTGPVSYSGGMTISNSGGDALALTASGGNGNGLNATANGTGSGVLATAGATGHGLNAVGGSTSGSGFRGVSPTSGDGAHFVGGGALHGMNLVAGATGFGLNVTGGSTSGVGIGVATTSGDGISVLPGQGHGITATGNSGSHHGLNLTGGSAGHGISAVGGANGDGLHAVGNGSGVDIHALVLTQLAGAFTSTTSVFTTASLVNAPSGGGGGSVNVTEWGGVSVTGMPLPTASYTPPTNFGAMVISDAGLVAMDGTRNPVVRNQDTVTTPNYDDCMVGAWSEAFGKEPTFNSTTWVKQLPSNSGPLRTFTITTDGSGNVTARA